MSLALEFVAAIGAVVAALVAVISVYLGSARLSLRCVGVKVINRDDEAGEASIQIDLAIHNKGRIDISDLVIRCALVRQSLRDAQRITSIDRLGAGAQKEQIFIPQPPARFDLVEGNVRLFTPLAITAQWGGKVRRMLPLPAGPVDWYTLELDLRPTKVGRLSLRARKAAILAQRSVARLRRRLDL